MLFQNNRKLACLEKFLEMVDGKLQNFCVHVVSSRYIQLFNNNGKLVSNTIYKIKFLLLLGFKVVEQPDTKQIKLIQQTTLKLL